MDFFLVRSFDHAGYYETRSILMVVGFGVALYYARRKQDRRYLIMFASGVFFQVLLEGILQLLGLLKTKGASDETFSVQRAQG